MVASQMRRGSNIRWVEVREERPTDVQAVRNVHRQAFGDDGRVVGALVNDLRATVTAGDGLSLVAERDGRVVGHVMFSVSLLDAPSRLVAVQVLSPLGVAPSHQRQGVGAALVSRGLVVMADRGAPAVFLEGSPDYYSRFGFMPAVQRGFRKPSLRIPDAAFQVFTLPAYEPWMTGTLVYAETFWRHDVVGIRDSG